MMPSSLVAATLLRHRDILWREVQALKEKIHEFRVDRSRPKCHTCWPASLTVLKSHKAIEHVQEGRYTSRGVDEEELGPVTTGS